MQNIDLILELARNPTFLLHFYQEKVGFRAYFAILEVCALVSPSRRTVSSLVTDCESEHDGLRVSINQTERTPLMRRMRVLDKFLRFWG